MPEEFPENKKKSLQGDVAKAYRSLGKYMGLGVQIAASIAFFMFVGYWVDKQINTSPIFLLVGFVMGMIGMFVLLLRASGDK
jgi:F0F1-type ATP synthase assembly protein I